MPLEGCSPANRLACEFPVKHRAGGTGHRTHARMRLKVRGTELPRRQWLHQPSQLERTGKRALANTKHASGFSETFRLASHTMQRQLTPEVVRLLAVRGLASQAKVCQQRTPTFRNKHGVFTDRGMGLRHRTSVVGQHQTQYAGDATALLVAASKKIARGEVPM